MRLVQNRELAAEDRNDFLAIASQTMRRVLVDYARTKRRLKRGGGEGTVRLEETPDLLSDREAEEVLLLDAALEKLRRADARAAQVVELRFFGGLSVDETAEALSVSSKTVQRTWLAARAWLRKEVRSSP
jgi:RNA polymerase sigma factor (TIGR02999 family)